MKVKEFGDSFTPWDYGVDSTEKPPQSKPKKVPHELGIIRKRQLTAQNRYQSERVDKIEKSMTRVQTQRFTIKLQERIPTDCIIIQDKKWDKELRQLRKLATSKKDLIIKLPTQVKQGGTSLIGSARGKLVKSQRQLSQKISLRNLKKDWQEIQQFSISRKLGLGKGNIESSNLIGNTKIKIQVGKAAAQKCSLKNMNVYQQNKVDTKASDKKRKQIISSKHILDRILSRFQ